MTQDRHEAIKASTLYILLFIAIFCTITIVWLVDMKRGIHKHIDSACTETQK